jgi:hypothetical protein
LKVHAWKSFQTDARLLTYIRLPATDPSKFKTRKRETQSARARSRRLESVGDSWDSFCSVGRSLDTKSAALFMRFSARDSKETIIPVFAVPWMDVMERIGVLKVFISEVRD